MAKNILYTLISMILLTACDKSLHEIPINRPAVESSIVRIVLNDKLINETSLTDVHIYWFDDTDKLCRTDYYTSMEELALAHIEQVKGSYTIIAVVNVGESFAPPSNNVTLTNFASWVHTQSDNYENMASGTLRYIFMPESLLITIDLEPKSEGVKEISIELLLEIPSAQLPDFAKARSTSNTPLRGIVYIYKRKDNNLSSIKKAMLVPTSQEGVYSICISLFAGDYDLSIWVDHASEATTDNHYHTSESSFIRTRTKDSYTANSDARDCFAQNAQLLVTKETEFSEVIKMTRPVAKYRLVATDITEYEKESIKRSLPSLDELQISILYQGYIPTAYNIRSKAPEGANTGYTYSSAISELTASVVTLGKDYVFMNGGGSSVILTLIITNKRGEKISIVPHIVVDCKAGYLTTIRGDFLTAGTGGGGGKIEVSTEWDDDYNIYL